ncbi:CopG family transcriptional regulator [Nostocaceae cyanobacterium CENA357]|uniref:CopG family transcriptional regulator n=1 Tax=Atlanticothrix silvestris CENA357 TaxID=1725252 RepID=A0A8J7HGX7_9CYAN|nr:CopG family transcriptional regulator [Atlanticothrix silvestris]MBH8555087.1 CopG family transcriptional regulator [Atlanticothrix silvestris CENA357]
MNKTATRRFSIFATPSKKWVVQQIVIDLTSSEAESLEQYCEQTGKASGDVIRELIRELPVS